MKFEVNLSEKKLTIFESISFVDIERIKKFIGKDWEQWKICAREKVVEIEKEKWIPMPYPIQPPPIPFVPVDPYIPQTPIYPNNPSPIWFKDDHIFICDTSSANYSLSDVVDMKEKYLSGNPDLS